MSTTGFVLIVVGIIGALFGLGMDSSVGSAGGRIVNIGLIADKQNILLVSATLFVSGVILLAAATLRDALARGFAIDLTAQPVPVAARPTGRASPAAPVDMSPIGVGATVAHSHFGRGVVIAETPDGRLSVQFDRGAATHTFDRQYLTPAQDPLR